MAKASNQKLKLLYLQKIFQEQTDENHVLTLQEIIELLAQHGIPAERKSLYDDFETLRLFGMDICSVKSKTTGYYLASRDFDVAELKLLVDGVQASKFITEKKTLQLIKKLETLCSKHEARQIRRQVYVTNRVKSMNESIYYTVDKLHEAISTNKKVQFQYFSYTVTKEKTWKRNGKPYQVSPFALLYSEENYYLLAFDEQVRRLKHFRVDKMSRINIGKEDRTGQELYQQLDMSAYTKQNFSMFGGELEKVTLQFDNDLSGVVIDRFGKDVPLVRVNDTTFRVTVPVAMSDIFLGWVFGLGDRVKIISPPDAVERMGALLSQVSDCYR